MSLDDFFGRGEPEPTAGTGAATAVATQPDGVPPIPWPKQYSRTARAFIQIGSAFALSLT